MYKMDAMKELQTITLKNDAILIRMEPDLKAALLKRSKQSRTSAASLVRHWICMQLDFKRKAGKGNLSRRGPLSRTATLH